MRNKKVTAIVLAAGKGSRMRSDVPKQYLEIDGKPILYYSLCTFEQSSVDDIVLVTRPEDVEYCRNDVVGKYQLSKVSCVVAGGEERYWSVWNGLQACARTDYVLIHDAARPCITVENVEEAISGVIKWGACTLGVPVKDTIKQVDDNNYGVATPVRKYLWQIQTPQSFSHDQLVDAYKRMIQDKVTDVTDDTMIVERYLNLKTKVIQGDYRNLKVTTPEDLDLVKIFLKKMKKVVDIGVMRC